MATGGAVGRVRRSSPLRRLLLVVAVGGLSQMAALRSVTKASICLRVVPGMQTMWLHSPLLAKAHLSVTDVGGVLSTTVKAWVLRQACQPMLTSRPSVKAASSRDCSARALSPSTPSSRRLYHSASGASPERELVRVLSGLPV